MQESSNALPSDEEGTRAIQSCLDAYATPLHYQNKGDTFVIISAGRDKEFGTADDVIFSAADLKATTPPPNPNTVSFPR